MGLGHPPKDWEGSAVTAEDFRRLALQFPNVVESSHRDHPDFRVGGKIFATLGYPSVEFATIMLGPAEQAQLLTETAPGFAAAKGAWGLRGSTSVYLAAASPTTVQSALAAAWAHKNAPASRLGHSGRPSRLSRPIRTDHARSAGRMRPRH